VPARKRFDPSDQGGDQRGDARGHSFASGRKSAPLGVRELKAVLHSFETTFPCERTEPSLLGQHRALLQEFEEIHLTWERRQVSVADGFNMLRTMRLTTKELCHSDILAWLLDHRLNGFGTHAQGNCGFQLFLAALNLPAEFGDADYRVAREVPGKESRLDIVIEAKAEFIIGIENKVTSKEIMGSEDGKDQTSREWADLERRGKKLQVPPGRIRAFFLTPDNQSPQSRNFNAISWRLVADVFERFAEKAKPEMVRLFAQHYAEIVRQDVVTETEIEEEHNEQAEPQ
jgi:hypothetical protein